MPKNPIIQKQSNSLKTHLKTLNASHIKVCVASKYATVSQMEELYNEGYRIFGENKLQDALEKQKALSHLPDIQWHFIGHLQRNKAKKAVENFDVIQSVDSLKLLEKIDNLSKEIQKTTTCYIQVNSGNDLNKFGFSLEDCLNNKEKILSFPNISVQGIMCIAPQGQTDPPRSMRHQMPHRSIGPLKSECEAAWSSDPR